MIAHRLATIEAADQILVVDGGTVAQRGTHDEPWPRAARTAAVERAAAVKGWRIGERVAR